MSGKKQYGLILPSKSQKKKELPSGFNVFAAAAEKQREQAEQDNGNNTKQRRVEAAGARPVRQCQVEKVRAQALAEDASVFDYDAVYDDMKTAREREACTRAAKRELEKKKPKYISTLLQQAKIREVEHDRIRERRLLNERKADDAMFGDKEKLVSASYKRKLQEMQQWDAEDARLAALEEQEDVTKQGERAMAGFYANLNKNIAMGGTTANARSAYTTKETQNRHLSTDQDKAGQDHPAKTLDNAVTKNRSTQTLDDAVAKNRSTQNLDDAVAKNRSTQTLDKDWSSPRNSLPVVEPNVSSPRKDQHMDVNPSKEDAIAAAKARYLARKSQRKQAPKATSG